MIDPHVHLRDWNENDKDTLAHGMRAALLVGINALFEMPNTSPPLTSRALIGKRLSDAQNCKSNLSETMTYGLYAGLTEDKAQREEMIKVYKDLYPSVIGFKLFACHSTGNMGIVEYEEQLEIYQQLVKAGYQGMLAVHCEKESFFKPEIYDPEYAESHCDARPPKAEIESVNDQLRIAEESGFSGILHICHVTLPETVRVLEEHRNERKLSCTLTCGVTAHHALLSRGRVCHDGNLYKVNPPLRDSASQIELFSMLREGRIDWIESDHAPHTITQKQQGASGIPGFSGFGILIQTLIKQGIRQDILDKITGGRFIELNNLSITPHRLSIDELEEGIMQTLYEYPYDTWTRVKYLQDK